MKFPALVIVFAASAVRVPTHLILSATGWLLVPTTLASVASVNKVVSALAAVPVPVPQPI